MTQEEVTQLEKRITKEYANTKGMQIWKNNALVYEYYGEGCDVNSKLHVYSVTKSILSILIGIAFDKGYLKDIDAKVLEFFPDYVPKKKQDNSKQITLRHLLTMSAPYSYHPIFAPYKKYFMSDDFVPFTLKLLGGKGKIGDFFYAGLIGPDLLSGILMKASGKSVLEFAQEVLFSPLNIHVESSIYFQTKEEQLTFNEATDRSGWVCDSKGVHTGGWGLTLSVEDMAKIGQLYLNDGVWDGKQIVSNDWIKECTTEHNRWKKENLPYGYLWWLIEDGSYAAMGDGGNVIYVNPKKELVISMACTFVPKAKDRLDLIKKHIEPYL